MNTLKIHSMENLDFVDAYMNPMGEITIALK